MTKNTPRHIVVYEMIRKHIETKVYPENSLLPSENEMCSLFGVTRPTIRQALSRLENDGFIKRHHGKGSIVQKLRHGMGILSLKGVTDAFDSQGSLTTKIIKKPVVQPWPDDFIYELTEEEKSFGCISMERIRLIDDSPVMMEKTYLVNIHLPRFCQKKHDNRSLFDTLRKDYQIEIKGGEQSFRAITSTKEVADILQIPVDQAILHLVRNINTNKTNFRLFSEIFCFTDRFYLQGSF